MNNRYDKSSLVEEGLKYGLLNWYPFAQKSKIAFSDGTKFPTGKVDTLILISSIEKSTVPSELIKKSFSLLKSNGHLFIATENRLGLRYFCGDSDPYTDRVFDGIENYYTTSEKERSIYEGRLFSRRELLDILEQARIEHYRGYSVLPGLEMPQQIYSWDYLPEEDVEIRFTPLYHNPGSVFLNEAALYDGIIKNGMFHQMANAYLIDISKDGTFEEIKTVTTSMDRGREKATATIIRDDETVEKKALFPEGVPGIKGLLSNTEELKKHGVSVVEMTENLSGDGVMMPYVHAETALVYLRRMFWEDRNRFIGDVDKFIQCIYRSSEEVEYQQNAELGKVYGRVYMDMVPLNAFYVDGEFVFFDQEFVVENYPVNVVIARVINMLYPLDRKMMDVLPKEYFWEKYGIGEKANALTTMGDQYIKNLRSEKELKDFNQKHRADWATVSKNRQRMDFSAEEYQRLFYNILDDVGEKKIYIFGAGLWAKKFIAEFGEEYTIAGAFDNNQDVWGQQVQGIDIMDPGTLKSMDPEEYKLVICVKRCIPILKNIKEMGVKNYAIYDPNVDSQSMVRKNILHCGKSDASNTGKIDGIGDKANEEIQEKKKYNIGYVAGVFDLFHVGHLNILKRAKEHCNYLIVGVVSDEQATKNKSRSPYVNEQDRKVIVEACKYVDEAFILPMVSSGTRDVYKKYHFDVQFSGSDYENDPYWLAEQKWLRDRGSDMVFFPYTQSTSSTKLKEKIESDGE